MERLLGTDQAVSWTRAVVVWLVLMGVEVVHGTVRTLWLTPLLGDFRAHQLSVLTGSALIIAVSVLMIGWLHPRTNRAVFHIGLMWLVLTVAFELVLGRALGYGWSQMAADYDLRHGGLMPIGLVALTLAPWLAARIRGGRFPAASP